MRKRPVGFEVVDGIEALSASIGPLHGKGGVDGFDVGSLHKP